MADTLLTPSIIAKEGLMQLDNNLVAAKMVYRAYESEFGETKIGDTLTIRRPVKYATRSGPVAKMQDASEGNTTIKINTQRGVDLRFPTKDLTLTIDRFAERYLKHPMIALANQVDLDILSLSNTVWNWVGTPGYSLTGYKSFVKGPQRLDEMAVPSPRSALLCPADFYGMTSSFTGLYVPDVARTALEKSKLPMVGNTDCFASQNVVSHTVGSWGGTPVISSTASANGVTNTGVTTYTASMTTNTTAILVDGLTANATVNAGDVFTIAGVYAVNPVTKVPLPYLQQFVVQSNVTATGTADAITIAPAIIVNDAAYGTVSAAPAQGGQLTVMGTGGGIYPQNMVFHENAFALCMVPMELPDGAVKKARQSYKGLSVRVICDYDIINDVNMWRLDILYGVKSIYPDLATRLSGASS
ncbi:MAG: P22 phage major capsid protein family protein [Rhodomicrobium sp.]